MPIYEYKCSACDHTFEIMQKVSDPPVKVCVKCSGPTNKVISSAGLVFKGSGWYITDYSSKRNSGDRPASEKESGKGADKGQEKKDSTKTAT